MMLSGAGIKQPPEGVRFAVRDLLTGSPEYRSLDPPTRLALAQGLVKICATALELASEAEAATCARPSQRPLSVAQSAGSEFSGIAAQKVAETTRQILNAVSFPRFVTELINGVFKALVDTNQQQIQSYVELIRNVAASTEGFADANVGLAGARRWLIERFPGSFTIEGESDSWQEPGQTLSPEEQAERDAETRLRLRPGASMPSEGALRLALGLEPQDSLPGSDPENLVPLARNTLARNRQQMLSTMVMLGLQRIVIESGRLHASMRFHIDTRSAAQQDLGSQFDVRNTTTASGSYGYGPWGASATMTNTIGYVSTQKTQTTEEMNTDLDLNSSVELVFKTDYLPLDRLAGREQVDRIKVNTLNPEAEEKAAAAARQAREKRIAESDAKRRESLDKSISPPPAAPATPAPGAPGSAEAADKARREAAERERKEAEKKKKPAETQKNTTSGPPPAQAGGGTNPPGNAAPTERSGVRSAPGAGNVSPAGGTARPAGSGGTRTDGTSGVSSQVGRSERNAPVPSQGLSVSTSTTTGSKPVSPMMSSSVLEVATQLAPEPNLLHRHPDVVFIPTPQEAVNEMLDLAKLKRGELLYDLGCGDGRIVVTAAKEYGCHAVGFDIDPKRVAESTANIRKNQLEYLARVEQQDIFNVDLSKADVVTIYLLPELNIRLIPRFAMMKPGARIVSHDFDMAGIIPDRVVQVYLAQRNQYKTFYLWSTPLKKLVTPVRHEWSNSKGLAVS